MFRLTLLSALLVACCAQYASRPSTAMSQDSIPAWYQMSKQAASPSYPSFERRDQFERLDRQPAVPQHSNSYSGYPSYNAIRSGSTYTDSQLPGQMPSVMPSGPNQGNRRYPTGTAQDMNAHPFESSISRYHKLLLLRKRKTSTTTAVPPRPSFTTEKASKPNGRTRKGPQSLRNIYSTIRPREKSSELPTPAPERPISANNVVPANNVETPRLKWKKLLVRGETTAAPTTSTVSATSTTTSTVPPTTTTTAVKTTIKTTMTSTTSTVQPTTVKREEIITLSEKPKLPDMPGFNGTHSRFICRHKPSEETNRFWRTIAPFRAIERNVEPGFRIVPTTTPNSRTVGVQSVKRKPRPEEQAVQLIEYLLPNSELLAAIKDVVAKFKASLDETGIDQDVRVMGNQLRNTWQQLRTGLDRGVKAVQHSAEDSIRHMSYGPVNEQLGRLFEKAVADATDARTIRN